MQQRNYTMGIDVGVGSLGVALLENDSELTGSRIFDGSVRIFPSSIGSADRRAQKSARKQNSRRRIRLERVKQILRDTLSVPLDIYEKRQAKKESSSVVAIRDKASRDRVSRQELGRAVYHIAKARGIRLTRVTVDNEAGEAKRQEGNKNSAANTRMHAVMAKNSLETVGQYLHWRNIHGYSIKARQNVLDPLDFFIKRDDTRAELEHILNVQAAYFSELTAENKGRILQTVFWEKESPDYMEQVGTCCYGTVDPVTGKKDKRLAIASPLFQRKRLLEEVNNLRIRNNFGELREGTGLLTIAERNLVLKFVSDRRDSTADQIKKAAGIDPAFNLSVERSYGKKPKAGVERKLAGDAIFLKLKPTVAALHWKTLSLDEQKHFIDLLRDQEDQDIVTHELKSQFPEWDDADIETVLNISFPAGYSAAGRIATRKIVAALEADVIAMQEAEKRCGLIHETAATGEVLDYLPYYGTVLEHYCAGGTYHPADPLEQQYGKIANPVVHQSLNQIRRVVNAFVKKYGPPAKIHIELSREMNKSQDERDRISRNNRKHREENEKFDETIIAYGRDPSRKLRRALRLHADQSGICPYTGRQMSIDDIFNGSTDLDHILPRSKSLQDRISNIVLCDAAANKYKGDRSPYEAFAPIYKGKTATGDIVDTSYEAILDRVKDYLDSKKQRFNADAMERFKDRNQMLDRFETDTSYIGKVAKQYLTFLVGAPSNVIVLAGGITGDLRYHWGVHNLFFVPKKDRNNLEVRERLKKDRGDSRHHLVDAIVIACANRSEIKRLQDWAARKEGLDGKMEKIRLEPWTGFREHVFEFIADQRRVSQKPDHNVNRKLHKETAYRILAEDAAGLHIATSRVPLSSLLSPSAKKDASIFETIVPKDDIHKKLLEISAGKGRFYGRTTDPIKEYGAVVEDLKQLAETLKGFYETAPETNQIFHPATKTKPAETVYKETTHLDRVAHAIDVLQKQTGRRSYISYVPKGLTIIRGPVSEYTDRPQGAYHGRSNSRIDFYKDGNLEDGWEIVTTLNEMKHVDPNWQKDPDATLIYSLRQKDEMEMWDCLEEETRKRVIVRLQNMSPGDLLFFPVEKTGTQAKDEGAIRLKSLKRFWLHEPVKIVRTAAGEIKYQTKPPGRNW